MIIVEKVVVNTDVSVIYSMTVSWASYTVAVGELIVEYNTDSSVKVVGDEVSTVE